MKKSYDREAWNETLASIMLDPLSYIHPRRLRLPDNINTPRQHAAVNEILLNGLPVALAHLTSVRYSTQHVLLQHWRQLPYVCTLVGAQLLKGELALRGRLLHLPAKVRLFMALPLHLPGGSPVWTSHTMPAPSEGDAISFRHIVEEPCFQARKAGLLHLLNWQHRTPAALLSRLRLLFAPEFDSCFESPRLPVLAAELFLLSQAIQYAKNHPDHL